MDLCKTPELAAQVALGPIQDFDFDVSILFSDLLFPLEALGMGLSYKPGPVLEWSLNAKTISQLKPIDEASESLIFQKQAAQATRQLLDANKSLIGFIGGPWTLFGYAVDGSHKGGLKESKINIHLFNEFCKKITPLLKKNIQLQLEGGVEIVMIFDTAAGELSPSHYKTHVIPQLTSLAKAFPKRTAYYSKGTSPYHYTQDFWQTPWAGLGFDHRWDLIEVLKTKPSGFIQGNFDQNLLFQNYEDFKVTLDDYLLPFKSLNPKDRAPWVCGLGHGVLPQTPEKNVKHFVQRVREVFS